MQRVYNISTIIYLPSGVSLDECAYVISDRHSVWRVDEFAAYWGAPLVIIPQGLHVIHVSVDRGGGRYSMGVTSVFLEAGKFYTTEGSVFSMPAYGNLQQTTVNVSIPEVTKPEILELRKKDIAFAKEYLDWTQTHYGMFEGTYQTKDKQKQISFKENKFEIRVKSTTYKGTFLFDAETMILCLENKNNKNLKTLEKSYMYYKFENNLFDVIVPPFHVSVKGQFFKID